MKHRPTGVTPSYETPPYRVLLSARYHPPSKALRLVTRVGMGVTKERAVVDRRDVPPLTARSRPAQGAI